MFSHKHQQSNYVLCIKQGRVCSAYQFHLLFLSSLPLRPLRLCAKQSVSLVYLFPFLIRVIRQIRGFNYSHCVNQRHQRNQRLTTPLLCNTILKLLVFIARFHLLTIMTDIVKTFYIRCGALGFFVLLICFGFRYCCFVLGRGLQATPENPWPKTHICFSSSQFLLYSRSLVPIRGD